MASCCDWASTNSRRASTTRDLRCHTSTTKIAIIATTATGSAAMRRFSASRCWANSAPSATASSTSSSRHQRHSSCSRRSCAATSSRELGPCALPPVEAGGRAPAGAGGEVERRFAGLEGGADIRGLWCYPILGRGEAAAQRLLGAEVSIRQGRWLVPTRSGPRKQVGAHKTRPANPFGTQKPCLRPRSGLGWLVTGGGWGGRWLLGGEAQKVGALNGVVRPAHRV